MERVAPSQKKRQALEAWLLGTTDEGEGASLSRFIRLAVEEKLQQLLEAEQEEVLGRARYARGAASGVYRNGYEPGTLKTAEGVFAVDKPQIRGLETPYRSALLERVEGLSRQLRELVVEMYTLGLSTRDVEQTLERALGGFVLSKSTVSVLADDLTAAYEAFKARSLKDFEVAYLFVDTVYEPLRRYGSKTGVMCAWGYLTDGARVLLDMTTSQGESFEATLAFLRGMVERGLPAPLTVTTDGAPGVVKAVEALWPSSWRIRCWFHKMQNLQGKVPPQAWPAFKQQVQDVRDAPTVDEGRARLTRLIATHEGPLPEACRCLRDDAEASLSHLKVLERHRPLVRTTNLVERSFVEERRRTKVIPHLFEEGSLTRLVFAVLIRIGERWARPLFSAAEREQVTRMRKDALALEGPREPPPATAPKRRSAKPAL
jgi:putative transposase